VTFPSDETAVESTQQIFGNLISALMVPLAEFASRQDYELFPTLDIASDIRGDVVLLAAVAGSVFLGFRTFDSPLRRSLVDAAED
jgi:FLVCR family feline leukemia virus subgroup C receptor-related protein